jgi:HlyD family secretion protein
VRQAQVDVAHTVITTPIDGVVVARNVDVGQTVAASLQAPTLFVIANDLSRLQVSASIDEADVGRVRAGQQATFRVDAFPNEEFEGTVEQVRLQPITVQNVVTYNTIIGVNNTGQRLMPGMTATVSVVVDRRDDVLRVPAAALRFRPEGFDPTAVRPQRTSGAAGAPAAGASPAAEGGEGGPRRRRGPRPGAASGAPAAAADVGPGGGRERAAGGGRPVFVFTPGADGEPQPVRIRQGISDGQFVEVVDGLEEGVPVITGVSGGETAGRAPGRAGASPASNPFQPQRPQRRTR